jgi:hypothetical protein
MNFHRRIAGSLALALLLLTTFNFAQAQQNTGSIRGEVKDQFGGIVLGAAVKVVDSAGATKSSTTNEEGIYTITGLAPGKYTVTVSAPGFAPFETKDVEVSAGRRQQVDAALQVTIEEQKVNVEAEAPISTDAEKNASALVLRGADLDALPDDPDDLAAALQALAGPSAGPNGGQIFVDGFTGGRMPPKEAIREIRINQNPFTAENDRPGGGRIEILTRPGSDRYRGSASFFFNTAGMNSRNPFAPVRAPFQNRQYSGNFSGPIIKKKSSFFFDFERRETDDNEIINANVVDTVPFSFSSFRQVILQPARTTSFSPRIDYQLNTNNTLVARYSFDRREQMNQGVGTFDLPSREYNSNSTQHTFQLTETAVLSPTVVNETRFQFVHQARGSVQASDAVAVNVRDAFTTGGAQLGLAQNKENRWELQNFTNWSMGTHTLRAGGRVRGVKITDTSQRNFGGTFVFNSLDQFSRTIQFQNSGLSPVELRALDALPSQFTINGGQPTASVSQMDFGVFIQDDWRVKQNFTLSLGLRYENQTNIKSNLNFGPRIAFAWSPGTGGKSAATPKTVIRGGFGVFFERFGEGLTLNADRFNGVDQLQFIVSNGSLGQLNPSDLAVLAQARFAPSGTVTNVPTTTGLTARTQTTFQVDPKLQAPYSTYTGLSMERQLPGKFVLTLMGSNVHTQHMFRSRNINAPVFVTGPNGVITSFRPMAGVTGDLFQYESSGHFNINQLVVSVRSGFSKKLTLFSNYAFSKARNDTDGAGTFPANQYDVSNEYGRASFDVRHRFFVGGNYTLPWYGISLSPLVFVNSSQPFNITTGIDSNGDRLFTDRPALATSATLPQNLRITPFGNFDIRPAPGTPLIPRNFGEAPAFMNVNLRMGKTWTFGDLPNSRRVAGSGGQDQGGGDGGGRRGADTGGLGNIGGVGGGRGGGGRGGGGGGRGGGGGGLFGGMSGPGAEKRYGLTLSLNFQNLLNQVNLSKPNGNLSSATFGQSLSSVGGGGGFGGGGGNSSAGNRRITAQVRFTF